MFPPESTMPIDMALPLYLSQEEFVFRTTKTYQSPLNSCLRFEHSRRVDQIDPKDGKPSNKNAAKAKKQVTFADHKGLSLTMVKVFSEFNDPIDIPLSVQEMLNSAITVAEEDKLMLDFTQPSSDYLHFRQCLENNYVSLEYCLLKEKALAGTIKVKNVSFEKSVKLRVTFDTWKSHTDVECMYMKDTYPSSYSDTFSFEVSLPEELRLHERIEFAICYEVGGTEYWDSNEGKNYRVLWSSMKRRDPDTCSQKRDSFDYGINFDRYGSPACSHGVFPDWPSYAGYENIGPYY